MLWTWSLGFQGPDLEGALVSLLEDWGPQNAGKLQISCSKIDTVCFSKGSQYWCELDYTIIINGSPTKKTQKLWRTCFDEEETAHDQRPVLTLIGETLSIPLLSMKTWPLPGSHYLSLAETRHGSRFSIFSGVICWYNIVKRGGDQS